MRVPPSGVITNEGGDYNNATGVYTAPYTGLYGFVLSVYKNDEDDEGVHCRIYRNEDNNAVAVAHTINKSGYRGASGATLLQLNEGETVFVLCDRVDHLDSWTSYMGFLLKAY